METDLHSIGDLVDQNSAETVQGKPQTVDRNFTEKRSSTRGQSRAYVSKKEDRELNDLLPVEFNREGVEESPSTGARNEEDDWV
ncbi:hypothetical protein V6N12_058364 [Hibiscus sabdariffa]|uniref:Uncharacterized protein n=1 Tax=Hibiscus sabdariffa TaxID=183260 RepID=A0ABR2EUI5_9ROSI